MTEKNAWPIPSFTCSLNFANCRVRAGALAKHFSTSLKSLSNSEVPINMNSPLSDSFDDIPEGDRGSVSDYHDENEASWSACNGHKICAMGTESDEEQPYFDISPASPITDEIVMNPPVPLPPLTTGHHRRIMRDRCDSYGSTDSRSDREKYDSMSDNPDLDCDSGRGSAPITVEVPDLLSAVSSTLTIMIGQDAPQCATVNNSGTKEISLNNAEQSMGVEDSSNKKIANHLDSEHVAKCETPPAAEAATISFLDKTSCGDISENRYCDSVEAKNNQTEYDLPSLLQDCISLSEDCDLQMTLENAHTSGQSTNISSPVVYEEISNSDENNDHGDHSDIDLDEERRVKLQRSTSLKTGKTPPGTPYRKKIVRFADAMGLDLEAVKLITQEDLPTVPKSAYVDLEFTDFDDSPVDSPVGSLAGYSSTSRKIYVPFEPSKFGCLPVADNNVRTLQTLFTVPGIMPNFLGRVRKYSVCLEEVVVSELSITCLVRVSNISFDKKVVARFTTNEWASSDDMTANYVHGSNDGETDKFSFTIYVPFLSIGQRLCFAIQYLSGDKEFWDSNFGSNYSFKCQSEFPDIRDDSANTWLHFL